MNPLARDARGARQPHLHAGLQRLMFESISVAIFSVGESVIKALPGPDLATSVLLAGQARRLSYGDSPRQNSGHIRWLAEQARRLSYGESPSCGR